MIVFFSKVLVLFEGQSYKPYTEGFCANSTDSSNKSWAVYEPKMPFIHRLAIKHTHRIHVCYI